ncbi:MULTISPECIES: hypothetical protein, partial [Spirulina sp. CCY15215]|uniref:hypothetical protein n=1 Tax=Spirulina sp. CCY15215 TaxID=2767591 RepID=UPI00194F62C8
KEQAQNITPSSSSQENDAIAPSDSQQIPPNLQKFVSPQSQKTSPTGQEKSPVNSPSSSSQEEKLLKRSRFDQHPGTQIPVSIQRDVEAQNVVPSSPSQTQQISTQKPKETSLGQASPRRSWLEQARTNLVAKLESDRSQSNNLQARSGQENSVDRVPAPNLPSTLQKYKKAQSETTKSLEKDEQESDRPPPSLSPEKQKQESLINEQLQPDIAPTEQEIVRKPSDLTIPENDFPPLEKSLIVSPSDIIPTDRISSSETEIQQQQTVTQNIESSSSSSEGAFGSLKNLAKRIFRKTNDANITTPQTIPETVITPDSPQIESSDAKQEISSRSDVAPNEPVQKQFISPISETVTTPDSTPINSSDTKQETPSR